MKRLPDIRDTERDGVEWWRVAFHVDPARREHRTGLGSCGLGNALGGAPLVVVGRQAAQQNWSMVYLIAIIAPVMVFLSMAAFFFVVGMPSMP